MISKNRDWLPIDSRILYVAHHSYPYRSDGYAVRTHGICKTLVAQGYTVYVINRPGWIARIGLKEGNGLDSSRTIDGVHYIYMDSFTEKQNSAVYSESVALEELFQVFKPSLVIAASNWRNALPALNAARSLSLPFYYEVRGFWEISRIAREPGWYKSAEYLRSVERETYVASSADKVFTLNPFMKDELISRGVAATKVYMAPNGYDELAVRGGGDRVDLPENLQRCKYIMGYVGSFNEYEGLDLLVRACGQLRRQGVDLGLVLVGSLESRRGGEDDGNQYDPLSTLRSEARAAGIEDHLFMPGRVDPMELEKYYNVIDLIVLPRNPLRVCQLVMPMKPLEALAYSKPVLVSDVDVLRSWADSSGAAEVFSAGCVDDLVHKIGGLLADPDHRHSLVQSGRQWLKENTWERTTREMVKAIEANIKAGGLSSWSERLRN